MVTKSSVNENISPHCKLSKRDEEEKKINSMASALSIKSSSSSFDKHSIQRNDSSQRSLIEDIIIVWFDQYINDPENVDDAETTKSLLREMNTYLVFFCDFESCFDYIQSIKKEKIILISSGSFATIYLEKFHSFEQIDSIFVFCMDLDKYLPLKKKFTKIRAVLNEHEILMNSLSETIEMITKRATIFGLFDNKQRSTRYLTRETASFLWFQLLTDVLKWITINDRENKGIEEMLRYCELYYRNNQLETKLIEEFRKNYKPEDAIFWYSKQSFVYRLVNKALRTEDIDMLYTFRAYITHLRQQISEEHEKLSRKYRQTKSTIIRLFRGLKMSEEEIHHMRDNIGRLISMNGFFSTSRDMDQAIRFAQKSSKREHVVGVLLEIEGDTTLDKMIFADISHLSVYPQEQEVLFDLATVFRIVHVEFDKGKNLWLMQLTGVEKSFYKANEYINSVAKDSEEKNSTLLFGRLMCDMGEYEKAENYFKRLLKSLAKNDKNVANIYFHLGRVSYCRGEYTQALEHYEYALKLQRQDAEPQEKSFEIARTLHNIGNIYFDQKQIAIALNYYEQALDMKRAVINDNPDHPSIATSLTAIGSIYKSRGNFEKALGFHKQAYEMKKLSLPHDHPSIAESLNHLGIIYQELDEYDQALECLNKSLHIKQKTLPSTHPSISSTLNNLGIVYRKQENYAKAFACYSEALKIEEKCFSPDGLDLADTYHNLCNLFSDQNQFEKALEMAHLKLNLLRKYFHDDDEQIRSTEELIRDLNEAIEQNQNSSPVESYF